MRIYLPFDFKVNVRNFLHQAGYAEFNDPNTGQSSYTRRLSRDYYPRFHLYFEIDRDNRSVLNLHLDQKKPSYAGSSAHNAEYDGEVVRREASLIQGKIKNQIDNLNQQKLPEKNKGLWSKLFH